MGFLTGKKALITGVASNRSIAYGIAQCMAREGAELAFTYQNEKLKPRVEKIAKSLGSEICIQLDVAEDEQINQAFRELNNHWQDLDILVHSIAFAPTEEFKGSYIDSVTRDGFQMAHDISSYSFVALTKAARPMLNADSALLTLSYLGAIKSVPNYNVMGPAKASLEANVRFLAADLGSDSIRVNAISAGPIKTLAAAGVGGIRQLLKHAELMSPLKRNVTIEDVGNTAAFLCSDLAAGITGEVIYVDGGYHNLGMTFEID
ncbi:MAG: enoyl-ACP reductase [Candidatus Poribacteria bacterium]|nr:enoyl-ACP reductase [Candidatus Poribacteria bacterium]